MGTIAIRGYGNYSIEIRDPKAFFLKLVGSRSSFDVTELEEFVQGQILELLPASMKPVREAKDLNQKQDEVSELLEGLLAKKLAEFGIRVIQIQVLSMLPAKEVLQALDERVAMDIIGDQKAYLLYKMANSLDQVRGAGVADPAQLMMSLMMSKELGTANYRQLESKAASTHRVASCPGCQAPLGQGEAFCSKCGRKLAP